jgi:hypothetical protein
MDFLWHSFLIVTLPQNLPMSDHPFLGQFRNREKILDIIKQMSSASPLAMKECLDRKLLEASGKPPTSPILHARHTYQDLFTESIRLQNRLVKLRHANAIQARGIQNRKRIVKRLNETLTRAKETKAKGDEETEVKNYEMIQQHYEKYLLDKEVNMKTEFASSLKSDLITASHTRDRVTSHLTNITDDKLRAEIFIATLASESQCVGTTIDICRSTLLRAKTEVARRELELELKFHEKEMLHLKLNEGEKIVHKMNELNGMILRNANTRNPELLYKFINQLSLHAIQIENVNLALQGEINISTPPSIIHPMRELETTEPDKATLIHAIRSLHQQQFRKRDQIFALTRKKKGIENSLSESGELRSVGDSMQRRPQRVKGSASVTASLANVVNQNYNLRQKGESLNQELHSLACRKHQLLSQSVERIRGSRPATIAIDLFHRPQKEYKYVGGGFRVN